jgi:cullin 1
MSYSYYILLYTSIYDFCTSPSRPPVAFTSKGGASLQGGDLYRKLRSFLNQHCQQVRKVC